MRRILSVIALGLLAIAGCAHDRSSRQIADETSYYSTGYFKADANPSERMVQGNSPCGGTVTSAPLAPPAGPNQATPLPADRLPSALPPVQAAPQPTDVLPPSNAAAVIPDGGANPSPRPQGELKAAATTPALPKPPPLTGAGNPESVQSDQILTGTVDLWRRTQRLRYSPADVEEANGGLVALVGDAELDHVTEGQRIRVRGFLIPSTDRTHPPTFQVQSVENVD